MAKPMGTIQLAPNVFWVGVKHYNRRLFDGLIPLPHGTSYNAYLVKGSEKMALIDTVNPGFEQELVDKIREIADPAKIDYVIMNHAEPDHANAGRHILSIAKNAKLVTGAKGKEAAMMYFGIEPERIMVVDESTKLSLGGKTLSFVDAPWLHWPETIFTYLEEDRILFPCDFFGSHLAIAEFYADEYGNEKTLDMAKLYFAEIMMPFRKQGQTGVEKTKRLDPKVIAPSHGMIWRDPKVILDEYTKWTTEKFEKKVMIVYVSMWGSTEKMALALREALVKDGIPVNIFDIPATEIGHIAKELVDTPVVIVAAPTVLNGVHPVAAYATLLVKTLRAPTKYAAVLTSHGWSGGAVKQIQSLLEGTKIEVLGVVDVKGPPKQEQFDQILELEKKIKEKLDQL
ncbi:MAG: FprA family A-type flavoprotein [Thermoplasmata archaeon]|jgi:flavorubredoxin|nr:FprA family A-type flavoprotein [Thermoplasmata archaeon]